MVKEQQIRKPWLAALLNLLLPGLGYVYTGKRVGFGVGILFTSLILFYGVPSSAISNILWLDSFIMALLFAYDGYRTAEEVNLKK